MKSKYRTIFHDGCEWLQYEIILQRRLLLFKWSVARWYYIRTDYYDYFDDQWEQWERRWGFDNSSRDYNRYVNSFNTNIAIFMAKYPLIEKWIKLRNERVREQRNAAHIYHKQIALRAGSMRYF